MSYIAVAADASTGASMDKLYITYVGDEHDDDHECDDKHENTNDI